MSSITPKIHFFAQLLPKSVTEFREIGPPVHRSAPLACSRRPIFASVAASAPDLATEPSVAPQAAFSSPLCKNRDLVTFGHSKAGFAKWGPLLGRGSVISHWIPGQMPLAFGLRPAKGHRPAGEADGQPASRLFIGVGERR